MTTIGKVLLGTGLAILLTTTLTAAPARADDPVLHRVKYTVSAANPIRADIYYLDNEPEAFFRWSHNPYEYSPNIQANVGPGTPWIFELMLANPDEYAWVSASSGLSGATPQFHCDLTVDGVVVASKDGPKGVLCSIRHW
jgi:hypothetical protein